MVGNPYQLVRNIFNQFIFSFFSIASIIIIYFYLLSKWCIVLAKGEFSKIIDDYEKKIEETNPSQEDGRGQLEQVGTFQISFHSLRCLHFQQNYAASPGLISLFVVFKSRL